MSDNKEPDTAKVNESSTKDEMQVDSTSADKNETTEQGSSTEKKETASANGDANAAEGDKPKEQKEDKKEESKEDDNVEKKKETEETEETKETKKTTDEKPKTPKAGLQSMYSVGEVVWVKLKGFPWWPAEVVDRAELPSNLKSKNGIYVLYFNEKEREFGHFTVSSQVKPFPGILADKIKKDKKTKRGLLNAILMAENGGILPADAIPTVKPKKRKASSSPAKSSQPTKRQKTSPAKNKKTSPTKKKAAESPKKKPKKDKKEKKKKDKTPPVRVAATLEQLQFLSDALAAAEKEQDSKEIIAVLRALRHFSVNLDILREIPIGRQVRQLKNVDDKGVQERAQAVYDYYKTVVKNEANATKTATPTTAPQPEQK